MKRCWTAVGTLSVCALMLVGCPKADESDLDAGVGSESEADGGVSSTDAGPGPGPDAGGDAGVPSELEALLDEPALWLNFTPELNRFGAAELVDLERQIPVAPVLSTTPNAEGLVGDPARSLAQVTNLLQGRPEHFLVRAALYSTSGTAAGPVQCTVSAQDGILLGEKIEQAEASDRFVLGGRFVLSQGLDSLRALSLSTRLEAATGEDNDSEVFTASLYLRNGKETTLTLTCGSQVLVVETATALPGGQTLQISSEVSALVTLVRNPDGRCVDLVGRGIGRGRVGSSGRPVALVFGTLSNGHTLAGHFKAVLGYSPKGEREVFAFKAVKPGGEALYTGYLEGRTDRWQRAGLQGPSGRAGSFMVRSQLGDEAQGEFRTDVSMVLGTQCR